MQDVWRIENNFSPWFNLHKDMIDNFVPESPGVYMIRQRLKLIYVGRSDRSLRARLRSHVERFPNATFCFVSVKNRIKRFRLEDLTIIEGRKVSSLHNKINAALHF